MRTALTYDDVLLVPQYSEIRSRTEVNLTSNLDSKRTLNLPIISSPMDTVTESDMAYHMWDHGALGIIHRYNSIKEQASQVAELTQSLGVDSIIAAAVGITGDFFERAQALVKNGASVICLDVAHGHHILMQEALISLKMQFNSDVHVMAGNVATKKGFNDLADWGADSVRCNIGGGSICSTRIQTGHGLPGLQTIMDCAESDRDAKIIADGGLRTSGDIVKALAAGADFVMLGSLLAGTDEAPGETIDTSKGIKKKYRGMASKDAQMVWRGRFSSDEGISTLIDSKGSVDTILSGLRKGIVSGLSYSGARTIHELQSKADWVRQSGAGLRESYTHILLR